LQSVCQLYLINIYQILNILFFEFLVK